MSRTCYTAQHHTTRAIVYKQIRLSPTAFEFSFARDGLVVAGGGDLGSISYQRPLGQAHVALE